MNIKADNLTNPDSDSGQCKLAKPICPICDTIGKAVKTVTPQHTLKRQYRNKVDNGGNYHFCENPQCDVVYFDCVSESLFKQEHLINRVTIKDEHPKTPLCYCYKVLKEDVLNDFEKTGTTQVVAKIKKSMKKHGCQCEKLNPRGGCCLMDIEAWLQGY
ncbi:MAG: hypothetical protein HQL68_05890 [Magnetococcales bacterium]|nr:hypothetical protein [Magnetococcales bacterium]